MQVMASCSAISPPLSHEISGPTCCSPANILYLGPPRSSFERPSPRLESPRDDPGKPRSLLLKPDQRSHKRLTVCSFQPLPSIVASPISTPTHSTSSAQKRTEHIYPSIANSTLDSSERVLFPTSTPTWIATPPTPPSKSIRRSNTTSTRRSPFTIVSPSTSFPASMHPHGGRNIHNNLKRCASVPNFSLRSKEAASSFTSFMGPAHIVQSHEKLSLGENPYDVTFSIHIGDDGPLATRRRREHSGSYVRPIFHLDNDNAASDKEDGSIFDKSNVPSPEEVSPAGSWSDHSIEDIWETERDKDALRKFHALKELLATEAGYLMDLKALVTVYLRNLPTLAARSLASSTTFGRASSSFTSGPWMHSYTQLQAAALASSATLPDTPNVSPSTAPTPVKESKLRYLFSDTELESLTRNAEEILQLHEHFVRELRAILEPLDFAMEMAEDDHGHLHLKNLDAAIRVVSAKFATEASRFKAYQSFCAGHAEAMDIMRKAYQQFPVELDAFESRCSAIACEMLELGTNPPASEPRPATTRSSTDSPPARQSQNLSVEDRKRAMSLTSLDGAVRSLRPRSSMIMTKDSVTFPSEPRRERSSPRIAFMDYMIKPIQRICKYPLLLDQLLPSKMLRTLSQNAPERSAVDVVVESAAQAMKHVAASVDEARHRQDVATQSALILLRIGLGSNFHTLNPSVQPLTAEFFSSLGNCLLSGSLDVMHYSSYRPLGQTSSIKVKYLGAFLYPGGYLVLVKVLKGRKYEPRHWFSLADFEIMDVEDGGAILPCSFKLLSADKHFELAAACQREKDAWLSSIHQSLQHVPSWTNEPTPSFRFDERGELLPEVEEPLVVEPQSAGLATIRSIPELAHAADTELTEPFFASLRTHGKSKRKRAGYEPLLTLKQEVPPVPSRRSSSTSVKAIFSPMASDMETVVIRRSSHAARVQVDQELQDITSQSCLTARSYAFSHEVELFQAPKTRSNSGIGMAGMARLSKHESVRVPRRRTTESLDSLMKGNSPFNSSTASRRLNVNKLSITSIEYDSHMQEQQEQLSSSPSPSPPSSQPSSSRDRVTSLRISESTICSLPALTPNGAFESAHHKPRSFVRNVRGLFHFRPISAVSPVSVIVSHPSQTLQPEPPHSASYNVIHRWAQQSLRRRARSVHDEPLHHGRMFDDPEKQS